MLKRNDELTTRRAPVSLKPNSYDPKTHTFEAVISTGAPVGRRDARGPYEERLNLDSINPASIIGKPVLTEHRHDDFNAHVGTVTDARREGGKLLAVIKLTGADNAADARRKIEDGILRDLSIGYRVGKWRESKDATGTRIRTAVEFEIAEVSLVAMPADSGATIRSERMKTKKKVTEELLGDNLEDTVENTAADRVQTRSQIRALARAAKLPADYADTLIDNDATVDEAKDAISERLTRRSQLAGLTVRQSAQSGDDPSVIAERRADAIYAEVMGTKPPEAARQYMGIRMIEHARGCNEALGISTRNMSDDTALDAAMRTRAFAPMTTSDFPGVVANVTNKVVGNSYRAAESPIKSQIARKTTHSNFKGVSNVKLSGFGKLKPVSEAGEVKSVIRGEAVEGFKMDTYAGIAQYSRKLFIDDDKGMLRNTSAPLGLAAAQTEAALFIDLLATGSNAGPVMQEDNKRLFHVDHGNLAASGDSPLGTDSDLAPLSAARLALRNMKGLDGMAINVTPKFVLVPSALETEIEQCLALIYATAAADSNPFSNKLTPLIDARLSGNGWYVFADPTVLPVLEYAYLSGGEGPQISSREGFDVLGMEFRVVLDFGCGAVDWRGAYRNPGA